MPSRLRLLGVLSSLALALGLVVAPAAAPAHADAVHLCDGYRGCASRGMDSGGYAQRSSTMYWAMYSGHNCTNYAAYRMVRSGMPNQRPWSGGGNAEYWGTSVPRLTDSTPRVGAVAWWRAGVWPAGSSGHVAYVERVVSASEIIISQDSWGGDFSWARVTKSGRGWPSGFIHFNDVKLRNTDDPRVSGTAKVGSTLTASPGSWAPVRPSFGYQWLADGNAIRGATERSYTVGRPQQGKTLRVRVTARRLGYAKRSARSAATAAVRTSALSSDARPTVGGTPEVGQVLSATKGTWTPRPDSVSLRWLADGEALTGATGRQLRVTAAMLGRRLRVEATARRTGYRATTVRSAATGPVAKGELAVSGAPRLSGAPRRGEELTLTVPDVSPQARATVHWRRDGRVVDGSTGRTYALTRADLGSRVAATVAYRREGYRTERLTSASSRPVKSEPTMTLRTDGGRGEIWLRAELAARGANPVTGVVRVRVGDRVLREKALRAGGTQLTLRGLRAGERTVTVRYLGNDLVARVGKERTVTVR